jgi:hypothetical protein
MKPKPLKISSDLDDAVSISGQTEIIVKTSRGRPIWLRQIHREKRFHQRFRNGWNFKLVQQPLTNAVARN